MQRQSRLRCVYGAPRFKPYKTKNHTNGDSLERQVALIQLVVENYGQY
nr:MAG TPA: hypothetical protein [Caudoviricetes sp.]